MPRIAQVAIDKATPDYDKLFSYLLPAGMEEVCPGCRVLVPFGAGNRKRQGMVFSVCEEEARKGLKPAAAVLDAKPLLDKELLALAVHVRNTAFCTYYEAVRLMIPAGLDMKIEQNYVLNENVDLEALALSDDERLVAARLHASAKGQSGKELAALFGEGVERVLRALYEKGVVALEEDLRRRVMDERIAMVRLCGEAESEPAQLTAKQRKVYDFLCESGAASVKETCYYAAVTRVVLDNMQKKGWVEYFDREVYRNPYRDRTHTPGADIVLSPTQLSALDSLTQAQDGRCYAVSLLYGVTGSGKTQVFLRLAQAVVGGGRGVLVLVPEISLTPQTIEKFHAYFGDAVAVIHSALSLGERLDEYKRIQRGEAHVVVGTRSAIFAPVRDLGLIIIDEEQEGSYKSEKSPRFHARDVAKWRAHYHQTQLVLASATPSVESYFFARKGVYRLVELQGRYTGSRLPDVYILDMSTESTAQGSTLAQRLCEELYRNLQAGEQSILLLNRRGYHTLVKCSGCGEALRCPNCSVSLTYHAANGALCCHYCGYVQPADAPCSACGGKPARFQGAGTQRVEEELHTLFPTARVLRMDMDTTMQRFSHERQFGAFAAHEYDMMVGTQMVAKGLNFPLVTLVGVLGTDQALYGDDFRSFERTFSLLTQVVGRAGRSERKGRAFIQTYSPDNPVITLASAQQYEQFFSGEIHARKLGLYPPYCDLCALGVTGEDESAVREASAALLTALQDTARAAYGDLPLRVLGPSDFAVYRVAGKYRRKLLLKCKNTARLRQMLRDVLLSFEKTKKTARVHVFVDLYYDSF